MAATYDPKDRKIELPAGDTMTIVVRLKQNGDGYAAMIFAVFDPMKKGKDLVRIPVEITENTAVVRLTNKDTRDLPAGRYKWQLRFVSDPEYDEDGHVLANDDDDNVLSLFGSSKLPLPTFIVRRDGAYV